MSTFALIPGDPSALAADSKKHEQFAELILSVSRQLDSAVDDSITVGKSVDAVRSQAAIVSSDILKAQPRYRDTALALMDFSVALQDAQQKAASANTSETHTVGSLTPWYHRRDILNQELRDSLMAPLSPDDLERLKRDIVTTQQEIDQLESDLSRASHDYQQAVRDRDQAAQVAIGRIRPALDALNDSFLDQVSSVLNDVTGFLAAASTWIAQILQDALFDIIVIAMAVVAIVLVLSFLLSIVGLVLGILFLTGVINVDDLQSVLNMMVTALLVVLPILVPLIYAVLYKESLTSTPDMTVQGSVLGDKRTRGQGVGNYQDAFITDDDLDNSGGDSHTTVSIIQVMNADGTPKLDTDGNPVWRVTLPSTQNWQLLDGDTGAMNDLGSNLALIMTPDQKAAYERSVVEAMTKAGIGPKDSVMLVGFSQGGILAGKMAAENPPPFNIKAIVVAGAPIDAMPIPNSVQVVAFQHPFDPVPQLDGASHADSSNWITIRDAPDKNQPDHGAISYGLTASHTVDNAKVSAEARQIIDKQSMFFSDNEIEHRYAGAESGVFG